MTPSELAEIRERLRKATPGPWVNLNCTANDAAFVNNAYKDIAALVEALEESESEIAGFQHMFEEMSADKKALQSENQKYKAALGQLLTMLDDCPYIASHARDKLITHIQEALK